TPPDPPPACARAPRARDRLAEPHQARRKSRGPGPASPGARAMEGRGSEPHQSGAGPGPQSRRLGVARPAARPETDPVLDRDPVVEPGPRPEGRRPALGLPLRHEPDELD